MRVSLPDNSRAESLPPPPTHHQKGVSEMSEQQAWMESAKWTGLARKCLDRIEDPKLTGREKKQAAADLVQLSAALHLGANGWYEAQSDPPSPASPGLPFFLCVSKFVPIMPYDLCDRHH